MGSFEVNKITSSGKKKFLKALLQDIEALDRMLHEGKIERGVRRIGAEQEFALVDKHFRPSKNGVEILGRINDPHFTSELAKYNLEINLDPLELKGKAFSQMEKQLRGLLNKADDLASKTDDRIILTGILPSIDIRSVKMDFMTPNPRYFALDEIIKELRGEDFELNILGVDELILAHTNILFEACNTSFQMHLQVDPDEFADMYNWAQMISGPVLAICANSPLLFGRQLWSETRISLFQQSIDMRSKGYHLREREQRVSFGSGWISCITDIYKNDITRFPLILTSEVEEDAIRKLKEGAIPKLKALNLHNGTIWKWNRPCYGVANGIAHLRIENRYIPSGPTVIDEMANFAFWVGLMQNMPDRYRGKWQDMEFDQAKENFYKAATAGIQSAMVWDGEILSSRDLVRTHLLPMASEGLRKVGVDASDIERYMGVIAGRVEKGQNGSRWTINSFRKLKKELDRDEALIALTADMHRQRKSRKPVHEWKLPTLTKARKTEVDYNYVVNVMRTDVITVLENDLVELVAKIMEWRNIRHIPVEDTRGKILGVITKKHIDSYFAKRGRKKLATAGDIMQRQIVTIEPETDVKFAMLLMIEHKVSCLPVVSGDQLVGIITDTDAELLWKKLKDRNNAAG
jgi:CBS domain-containing protein